MGLILPRPEFVTAPTRTSIRIHSVPGLYSVTNTGGLGSPNTTYSDLYNRISDVYVYLSRIDTNKTRIDYDRVYMEISDPGIMMGDFPMTLDYTNIKINGTAVFSGDDYLPDGIYKIYYYVTKDLENGGGSSSYSDSAYFFNIGTLEDSIIEKASTLSKVYNLDDLVKYNKSYKAIQDFVLIYGMYKSLQLMYLDPTYIEFNYVNMIDLYNRCVSRLQTF